jgi:hypothetical protein
MNALVEWETVEPFIGPPCPDNCPEGMFSHTWIFRWDAYDGPTLHTDECPICNRGAQRSGYPHEHLVLHDIPVRLEGVTEVYGYETPEYDHFVVMHPVTS